jgi:ribonuclease D
MGRVFTLPRCASGLHPRRVLRSPSSSADATGLTHKGRNTTTQTFDPAMIPTPDYVYVTTPEVLADVAATMARARVIGVDTEADSLHCYQERVSLIQVSDGVLNAVIDPLLLPDLHPLAPILADPGVIKVFHGADYDVVGLKRDFGFTIATIFDTCLAAQASGAPKYSLGDLLQRYFEVTLEKKYQKAHWSKRPLAPDLLTYAAKDTQYLPALHELLRKEVDARGRLAQIEEEGEWISRREWTGHAFVPDDYTRIKGASALPPPAQRVLRSLAATRDRLAKRANRPPFKIVSADDLLALAVHQPTTPATVEALFPSASSPVRRDIARWIEAVRAGLADDTPLPQRAGGRFDPFSAAQERLFVRLREWRTAQSKSESVEPAMVLSTEQLKTVVRAWPKTINDLAAVPGIRRWQAARYGEALLGLLT